MVRPCSLAQRQGAYTTNPNGSPAAVVLSLRLTGGVVGKIHQNAVALEHYFICA